MRKKVEEAKLLVSQKKFKKALSVLKKISHKDSLKDFEVTELEASCLFQLKNYQLAKIKLEQGLKVAKSNQQKLNALGNLAAVSMQLNLPEIALSYLIDVMAIDDTSSTYGQRHTLVSIAFSLDNFEVMERYAAPLFNTLKYSVSTRILLAHSAIKTDRYAHASEILSRLSIEIRTPELISFTPQDIVKVLDAYHLMKAFEQESSLLNQLRKSFGHTPWFAAKQQRLQAVNKESKSQKDRKKGKEELQTTETIRSVKLPSEIVSGNTPKTVLSIKKLKSALEQMGAWFHPDLRIVELDNDISVYCACSHQQSEVFMEVPVKAMPLLSDYHFSLDEHANLVVDAKSNMVNRHAKNIMFLLADMYNCAGKLASWKSGFPLFALAEFPVIVAKLLQGRSNSSLLNTRQSGPSNQSIINTFVESRVFGFSQDDLRKADLKPSKSRMQGFIPIIELANHQMGGEGFLKDNKKNSLILKSGVGRENREVFVQYNLDDPLVTFVKYGFYDQSANWIYSIPVRVQTSKGLIFEIRNSLEYVDVSTLPQNMQDLSLYFPANCARKGDIVYLSKLIIPQVEHAHTLNNVLTYILKQVDLHADYEDDLPNEVFYLEKQIIRLNQSYWNELKSLVEEQLQLKNQFPSDIAESMLTLCNFSLTKISDYIRERSIDLM